MEGFGFIRTKGERRFYSRYKFLALHTVDVSGHVEGSNDVEDIVTVGELNILDDNTS